MCVLCFFASLVSFLDVSPGIGSARLLNCVGTLPVVKYSGRQIMSTSPKSSTSFFTVSMFLSFLPGFISIWIKPTVISIVNHIILGLLGYLVVFRVVFLQFLLRVFHLLLLFF